MRVGEKPDQRGDEYCPLWKKGMSTLDSLTWCAGVGGPARGIRGGSLNSWSLAGNLASRISWQAWPDRGGQRVSTSCHDLLAVSERRRDGYGNPDKPDRIAGEIAGECLFGDQGVVVDSDGSSRVALMCWSFF